MSKQPHARQRRHQVQPLPVGARECPGPRCPPAAALLEQRAVAAAAVAAAAQTVKLHAKQLPPVGLEQAEVLAGGLAEGLAEAAAAVEVPMERGQVLGPCVRQGSGSCTSR